MKKLDSWLRIVGYTILLFSILYLVMSVKAQDMNREARYQRWLLISMEMSDVNEATSEWNSCLKRYKTLDDINSYELLYALRKAQAANAKIEEHLMALDVPIGQSANPFPARTFVCACGKEVLTNDPLATKCDDCLKKP
jgi:hypothetical protein